MEPEYWKRAIIKLKKEDVILKSVIERNQKNILKSRKDPFGTEGNYDKRAKKTLSKRDGYPW